MTWFSLLLAGEKWYLEMTEVTSPRTLSLLLVSLADKKLGLTCAMAGAITDHRDLDSDLLLDGDIGTPGFIRKGSEIAILDLPGFGAEPPEGLFD